MDKPSQLNVGTAISKHLQGSGKDYNLLLNQLLDPEIDPALLLSYLRELKDHILLLDKQAEVLVGVILKVPWLNHDTAVVKAYQSFVVNLVSAHTFYLRACLRMIVRHFQPNNQRSLKDESTHTQDLQLFHKLHGLLSTIIKIVPMTPLVLLPLLGEMYPYLNKSVYIHECYATNLLQVSTYLPTHRSQILQLITDCMMKLDVQCPRQEIEASEDDSPDESDNEQQNVFDMDEVDMELTQSVDQMSCTRHMTHKEADKLDVLMALVFRFIHTTCFPNGELDWEATKKLYRELLLIFSKLILPTHASCHTQFIMFYICSFKEPLAEGFLDFLWKKVQDPNMQGVFRQAAVAYIASFLARAKYLSVSLISTSLELMVSWVHKYMNHAEYTNLGADVRHHGPFYSTCQAIFYILAFRHKQLMAQHDGYKFLMNLNLQTVVTSRLNPLRVCLPVIGKTFASVTRMHQLALCDTILERNKRLTLPVEGSSSGNVPFTAVNLLDSYFPFDPYLLTRSGGDITPLYKEYEGIPVEEEDHECIEEDKLYSAECGSMETGTSWTRALGKTPNSPTDFMLYGTSPGFKHI